MSINKGMKKHKYITPTRVLVLGFALIIFVGAFLLCLPWTHTNGEWFPFEDALFTATSAVCVTGLTVVDTAMSFNAFGQAVILLLIQIGGLGVMTAATLLFIMVGKKITLKSRLVLQEALNEDRLQGIVKSIKKILIMTFSIELIGALILMCSFIPHYGAYGIWVSIFTSVSAFCNAGFDILSVVEGTEYCSLTPFVGNAFVCLPIMALIVVGGIGFMVLTDIGGAIRKRKRLSIGTKIVLWSTLFLIVLGWITFMITEWNTSLAGYDAGTKVLASLMQSVSPRTAGFYTVDQASLSPIGYMMTLFLMFIGASPLSTGGGVKTTTMVILILTAIRTLQGEKDVVLRRSKINQMSIRKAITLVMFALTLIFLNAFIIMSIEAENTVVTLDKVIFEVVSAFSTVGLSMGITPTLSIGSKFVLMFTMYVGRVGALTIGFSLVNNKKDFNNKIEYTDAKIVVG